MTLRSWREKTAIVIGASNGLGESLLRVFAQSGWTVIAAARSEGRLNALAGTLADAAGHVIAVPTDFSRRADIEALLAETRKETGRIDILINNAGMVPRDRSELSNTSNGTR